MRKRLSFLAIILLLTLLFPSCTETEDKVLNSLGKYKSHEFYTEGEFQDYTDYAKYYYDSVDFTDNEYFSKIEQSDLDKINECLDDFESFIATYRENDSSREIVTNYDFNRSLIDFEDYLYIHSEAFTDEWADGTTNTVLVSYDIYFFDAQSNTLYYFHNNI